jgi:Uma2 family endonuclease
MNWKQVCEYPVLQDLPFRIELNEMGQIIMSPVSILHSLYAGEIEYLLRSRLKKGKTLPECAIRTRKGTKVADVAWVSSKRLKLIRDEFDSSIAPEICVEVLSESNTEKEMRMKRKLYFDSGASEVWICDQSGNMRFYNADAQLEASELAPNFPQKIRI